MLTEHTLKTDKKMKVNKHYMPAKANVRIRVNASKQEIPITAVRMT